MISAARPTVCGSLSCLAGGNGMKQVYLTLAVIGWVVPYYFLAQFVAAQGFNLSLLVQQLLANSISTFFAVDLLITAIVFWVWSYREARKLGIKRWWLVVAATLTIGPSFALPAFLFVRSKRATLE